MTRRSWNPLVVHFQLRALVVPSICKYMLHFRQLKLTITAWWAAAVRHDCVLQEHPGQGSDLQYCVGKLAPRHGSRTAAGRLMQAPVPPSPGRQLSPCSSQRGCSRRIRARSSLNISRCWTVALPSVSRPKADRVRDVNETRAAGLLEQHSRCSAGSDPVEHAAGHRWGNPSGSETPALPAAPLAARGGSPPAARRRVPG